MSIPPPLHQHQLVSCWSSALPSLGLALVRKQVVNYQYLRSPCLEGSSLSMDGLVILLLGRALLAWKALPAGWCSQEVTAPWGRDHQCSRQPLTLAHEVSLTTGQSLPRLPALSLGISFDGSHHQATRKQRTAALTVTFWAPYLASGEGRAGKAGRLRQYLRAVVLTLTLTRW